MSHGEDRTQSHSDEGETAEDFYLDLNGLMVFTRSYHLKRGYCCGSGCRHCPWRGTPDCRGPLKKAEEDQR